MTKRQAKLNALLAYAVSLMAAGLTKTFDDLALWLNQQGFKTSYGTPYTGGRGVARLVDAGYHYTRDELGLGDAGAYPIAKAFTDRRGKFAYD